MRTYRCRDHGRDHCTHLGCMVPCELHNVMDCTTCHKRTGQCECGGCQADAQVRLYNKRENGSVGEVRRVCHSCASLPFMQQYEVVPQ